MLDAAITKALSRFDLAPDGADDPTVRAAFRALAKLHHPDTKHNYKEKLLATERLRILLEDRDLLLGAVAKGVLPTTKEPEERSQEAERLSWTQLKAAAAGKSNPTPKPKPKDPFDDHRSDRQRFDKTHLKPSERLEQLPVIGPLFSFLLLTTLLTALAAAGTIAFPVYLLWMFVTSMLPEKTTAKWKLSERIGEWWNFSSSIPVLLMAFPLVYLGMGMFVSPKWAWVGIGIAWSMLALMIMDEFYSMVRYRLLRGKLEGEFQDLEDAVGCRD